MKKLPKHRSEAEERDFWAKEDSSEFIDWKAASRVTFSKLKPSLRTISLRLPEMMIEELKLLSNKMDAPYQTLIKIYLSERKQGTQIRKGVTLRFKRVLKNKHQAVSQDRYKLEARGLGSKQKKSAADSPASSFAPPASSRLDVSIYKSRTTPDHGLRRGFSTPC